MVVKSQDDSSPKPKNPYPSGKMQFPEEARVPINDLWKYSYFIYGDKKIGKTSWAVEGCDAAVLQFDRPSLSLPVRELLLDSWENFKSGLDSIKKADRIVVDGVGDWYRMCQTYCCKGLGIKHPSEVGYSRGWHDLRDEFIRGVMSLQKKREELDCGLVFIGHGHQTTLKNRSGTEMEVFQPAMPAACKNIVMAKVDGTFAFIHEDRRRFLLLQRNKNTEAGHSIPAFYDDDGKPLGRIDMGNSPTEAMNNFIQAFHNSGKTT